MTINFEELPVEAIARVFGFLDYKDLLTVSRLSHQFRDVYKAFPELQYSFALQVAGMVDGDPTENIRKKQRELERRERAWRTMDFSRKVTVRVPYRTTHIYDLSGGVYLLGDSKDHTINRGTLSLRFFDLSKCASGPRSREGPWPEIQLDTKIIDIGFNLQEFDLVAVVGLRHEEEDQGSVILSLRELSTGEAHPLARVPDIVVDQFSGTGKLSIMMEIVGPRLLLLLSWQRSSREQQLLEQDKLFLFNWWTGTKVVAECAPSFTWNGFVFLSPDLALLPDLVNGLQVIRLPDVSSGYSSKGFERVLNFALPSTHPSCKNSSIQCRAEPNTTDRPHPSILEGKTEYAKRMRARKRPMVAPDAEKAIVLLQFYYREYNNSDAVLLGQWGVMRHNVSLVVHRSTLLDLFAKYGIQVNPSPTCENGESMDTDITVPTVPWKDWGKLSRWQADDTHMSNWITVSAGQRYAGSEDDHVIVKDYNPVAVRRARAALEAAKREAPKRSSTPIRFVPYVPYSRRIMNMNATLSANLSTNLSTDSDYETESDDDGYLYEEEPYEDMDDDEVREDDEEQGDLSEEREEELDEKDLSWRSVRVVDGYNDIEQRELKQLFSESCEEAMPCVEYKSKREYDYHGLLMDEERIIGLIHDENFGAVVKFDVFTL